MTNSMPDPLDLAAELYDAAAPAVRQVTDIRPKAVWDQCIARVKSLVQENGRLFTKVSTLERLALFIKNQSPYLNGENNCQFCEKERSWNPEKVSDDHRRGCVWIVATNYCKEEM